MTKMVAGISKAAVEREAAMMEASSNFIWAKKLRALRAALDKAEAERDQLLKPLETLQAQNFRLSGMVHDLRKALQLYAEPCDATETSPCGYEGNMCCRTARAALR